MTSLFSVIQYGAKGKQIAYHLRGPAIFYIILLLLHVFFSVASTQRTVFLSVLPPLSAWKTFLSSHRDTFNLLFQLLQKLRICLGPTHLLPHAGDRGVGTLIPGDEVSGR